MSSLVALDVRCVGRNMTGDTIYWTGILKGLMSRPDSNVRYLLCSNAPRPDWVPQNSRFEWLQVESKRQRWWSLFRFPLAARRRGAKVIHTQYNLSPLVSKGGVTTIHDLSFFHEPEWFRPQDRLLLQRFVPPSARRAEKVITVSEFSRLELAKFLPDINDKVVVAHNACPDTIVPVNRAQAQERLRQELGIEEPFLLTVGTRWPRKNLNLAIEAVSKLPDSLPHRLVVTGKPGWGDESAGDRVLLPGFVPDSTLNDLYSAADAYLAPSHYEGFGITLLEAFRSGCPVVASDIPAHREVGGAAALYPPSMEPDAWAQTLETLLTNEEKRLALMEAGRLQEGKFSWTRSAEIHEGVYQSILGV